MAYTFDRIEIDLKHGGITLHGKVDGGNHPIRFTADDDPALIIENNRVSLGQPEGWIDTEAIKRALAYRDFALNEEPVKASLAARAEKRRQDEAKRQADAEAQAAALETLKAAEEAAFIAKAEKLGFVRQPKTK